VRLALIGCVQAGTPDGFIPAALERVPSRVLRLCLLVEALPPPFGRSQDGTLRRRFPDDTHFPHHLTDSRSDSPAAKHERH
jgi:hypothetical protein